MTEEAKTLAGKITEFVLNRGHVSFVELGREFPDHFKDGNMSLMWEGPKFSNIILWTGITNTGLDALDYTMAAGTKSLMFKGSSALAYLIDGGGMDLKIAKSARHYKKTRWLPVVLHEADENAKRKAPQ